MTMKPFRHLLAILVLIAPMVQVAGLSSASAAPCPRGNRDGLTVGKINVAGVSVDVKRTSYPAGKEFDPPSSPRNAGVSVRHRPLSATVGSTLIGWHINYAGCIGKLNVIMNRPVGFEFSVRDELGATTKYKITAIRIVPKGKYRKEWFYLSGKRQLVMVTCTGRVVNGHYTDNYVVIAEPVNPAPTQG
jgi:hypothetical protein